MIVDAQGSKPCKKCHETKPLSEFYFNRKSNLSDNTCKECVKSRVRSYRESNLEKCREYDRQRYRLAKKRNDDAFRSKYRKPIKASTRAKWCASNPRKRRAQIEVRKALQSGDLVRPKSCEVCACKCTPHAHHSDYRHPLKIHWLCPKCHGRVHSVLNEVRRQFGEAAHDILPEVTYGT